MKRKAILLCLIVFPLLAICIYMLSQKIHKDSLKKERINKYEYSITVINDNLYQFESLCEYDLENYKGYELKKDSSQVVYCVLKQGQFQHERDVIFQEIGLYNGFDSGIIDPENETIVFTDDSGSYLMQLIYYKNGNDNTNTMAYKIGEHFTIHYSSFPYSE